MRILILSQWCYPEPDFKALTFGRELVKLGHTVQVLTGFPNYPGGEVYKGYKVKWSQRETIDGVEIIRVPLYPSHDNSGMKRGLNYLSFAMSAALLGVFRVKKADVMYVYHPPATVAIPAVFIKWLRRIPVVYDIQDLWPDTLSATGLVNSTSVLKWVGRYCNFMYKRLTHITVLSPGFKNKLIERGVPAEKIDVIYNWPNPMQVPAVADKSLIPNADKKFTILFAGTMGKAQALDVVLDAAKILQDRNADNIQFAFIGGGIAVDELKAKKEDLSLSNVVFLPRVGNDEIGKYLVAADALLVHLKNDELFKITIPSKTQAYLQVGRPIIMAVGGDADALVHEAQAGISCIPENATSIVEVAQKLSQMPKAELETMGQNGKKYYELHLSMEHGVSKFLEVFHRVAHV
jgi:colanic acid biosynthesis glycosyl transferase WcaI